MRKFTNTLGIIIVFLLSGASLNDCHNNDVNPLETASIVKRDNQAGDRLVESLDSGEFENLLSSNKDNNNDIGGDNREASSELSTCQLVQIVHVLRYPGCQSKAIASFACSGSCASYVKTSTSNFWQRERSCSCCQQTGSREATFALDCPSLDPPYRKVKTHAPLDCICRSCTDLSRENLRPQELVEALQGQFGDKQST